MVAAYPLRFELNPMQQTSTKILVVDDNAQNRALAQATLEGRGYSVILAETGEEGVRAVQKERPDCVLLDVRMPGTDGFAVCSRIRALPEGSDTPVVFLTALRDVDTFDQALRAGGDDFLTKPVRPTELVLRIQAAPRLAPRTSRVDLEALTQEILDALSLRARRADRYARRAAGPR
jgi:two-component system sensor histidine kinase/response regulator